MDEKTYNGWSNYETWATALWLDNEASSSAFWREQTRECREAAPDSRRVREWGFSPRESARLELAERLKEAIHEANPLDGASLFSDLLWAAISEIDWHEIAGHYVAEVADEMAEELGREETT